jgi:molecular chaperone DnaK
MASRTVDYGLDLGTTNSAIFRAGAKGAEVVPLRQQNYMPSAVASTKRGDLKVGTDALKPDFAPIALQFKRLMGGREEVPLADGSQRTPQALSAEVLKELKAAAKRRFDEDVEEVVITVPAMFSQPQCAATHEAAELAGLRAVTLLQEPIAAATAFLSEDPREGHYLVYDLGGGTFDVSLVRLHDGEMNVVEHGGDNYLGGSDLDRAVVDWALGQLRRKGVDVAPLEKGKERFLLGRACEEARIQLSDVSEASIYLDELDLSIAKLVLSRETLEDLIEPFVTRTIEIAKDRLKGRGLSGGALRSVLLVGGPTQTPYVRRRLREAMGAELDFSQDPMTVVAKGAAIHASTLVRGAAAATKPQIGKASIELFYDAVSPEAHTSLAGKVVSPEGFKGEVRVTSDSGDLDTGWRPLVNGAFSVDLTLGRGTATTFRIQLRDLRGDAVPCEPGEATIRSGVRSAQPITPYNYGVVLEGGKNVRPVIKENTPLPATGSAPFQLARTLIAGSPDELPIYFVEGPSSSTEDNLQVGVPKLKGTDVRRTLKEGEQVEIRIRMDESRLITARVYVPLIDEEWTVEMRSFEESPNTAELGSAIRETKSAMADVERFAQSEDEQDLLLRAGRDVERLENTLDRVGRGEIGEAERIQSQLSAAKAAVRPLLDRYALKARHAEVLEFIEESEDLCRQFDDRMGIAKLADLRQDADKCLRLDEPDSLEGVWERVKRVFWEHYGKTRECWEYQVSWMRDAAPYASDPVTFYELVRRAEDALSRGDHEGVRLQALRAYDFLPEREKAKSRFMDAGVR